MATRSPVKPATPASPLSVELDTGDSYEFTRSPDGKLESTILLHSRMGIRIEFNLHRNSLSLWLSPQAGKSVDYRDRNFSCRDDHTSIFDRITLPELHGKRFVRCDYDPFHSVLHFERQKLHVATLIDKPVVLLWAEREEVVDFKSDKQDSLLKRTDTMFAVRHPDRGKLLDFAAGVGPGAGSFWHQPEVDDDRSTYARVVLAPEQLLVIGGELTDERLPALVARTAAKPVSELLAASEKKITTALRSGRVTLKAGGDLQRLYDTNMRHLLSVQDASGAMRAALKYVYYLIWTTDAAVTATAMFQTGWREFMRRYLEFTLANPTSQNTPPRGRFYGQLTNGRITKREEFGALCAVWPAYMYWGLTGDDTFVRGAYLRVLEDAVRWLEEYTFDEKMGALGAYYHGGGAEDPFYGSGDFGWDAAVGCPMSRHAEAPMHEGKRILRTYELGLNLDMYNMYLMLATVTRGAKARAYLAKARTIETFLRKLHELNAVAWYRLQGVKDLVLVKQNRHNRNGHSGLLAVQGRSPAFFMPDYATLYLNRQKSFTPLTPKTVVGLMPCGLYGRLAGLDTEFVDEDGIMQTLEAGLKYHVEPSHFNPMPYTMVETLGVKDGEYHDIRPQAFSAGPFQAAVTNLAVRTMPFGIALRGTKHIRELSHFEYLDGHLDIRYKGTGAVRRILLNGKPLEHTLQIPDSRIRKGANSAEVQLAKAPAAGPVLVFSTVRLHKVDVHDGTPLYDIEGYCQNVLVLRDTDCPVTVTDTAGRAVSTSESRHGRHLFVEFWGSGRFIANLLGPERPRRIAQIPLLGRS
ncbi:MAG: hypothetical protein GF331_24715 [Chitinivibrionales bacterium]|nr:hypothetical protein [Chitinivibrionales bacterium]